MQHGLRWLLLLCGLASTTATCDALLFVYFTEDLRAHFALSDRSDSFKFKTVNSGEPIPELAVLPPGDSVRDPYVARATDGVYRMVATNGKNTGGGTGTTDTILLSESNDLLNWTAWREIPVMAPYKDDIRHTWAPEWVYDVQAEEYVIFWATDWKPGHEHFEPRCDHANLRRFSFWAVRTRDWQFFSEPSLMVDPQCMVASFAPMQYGDGGIDGTIFYDDTTGKYSLFYKDTRAPTDTVDFDTLQHTSGIRVAATSDLSDPTSWTPQPFPANGTVGPWGTEGPELIRPIDNSLQIFFDCSFQPTPPGYPRPPYGVAVAPFPDGLTTSLAWKTVEGSCVGRGDSESLVDFPMGATHGGFLCVSAAQAAAIASKWP